MKTSRRSFIKTAATAASAVMAPATLLAAAGAAEAANGSGAGLFLAESSIQFGPCVTSPEKFIRVGLNYRKHAVETGNPVPKLPIWLESGDKLASITEKPGTLDFTPA